MPKAAPTEEEFEVAAARHKAAQIAGVDPVMLEEIPIQDRPLYYNPIFTDGHVMLVGSRMPMKFQGGRIYPSTLLEEQIVRRHLERHAVGGPGAADRWKGDNLPDGRQLRCPKESCGFTSGNLDAVEEHKARFPDHATPRRAPR